MLAWEGGAGRGHVVTLARVARALSGLAPCDASLGWMDHAAEIAPWCEAVFPGVNLPYDRDGRKERGALPSSTWAEWLNDCGFANGPIMAQRVGWWLDTLQRRDIGLLIGDYAPCALMAGRIAGIATLAIGTGYGIPPSNLPNFPVFLDDFSLRETDEAQLVEILNHSLGPLGLPSLTYLPEIYTRSGEMVRSLAMLDPYCHNRTNSYLPPVADYAGMSSGKGDTAFCYFSTTELENEDLVIALESCRLPLRAYIPKAPDGVRERLATAGMKVESKPIPVTEIAATARVLFNSGQHGMLCLGLAAGIPQLCMPQHLEQLYVARKAQEAGVANVLWPAGSPSNDILEAMQTVWEDATASANALELASTLAPSFALNDTAVLRASLEPWL